MKIKCIGGGPAGLYLGILMKKANPAHQVDVYERNRADDTFGFGVVFSDATLGNLAAADPVSYAAITEHFAHWDDIDTHLRDRVLRSTGHGFCGLERKALLEILQRRCQDLGVELHFNTEIADVDAIARFQDTDLVVAADGVASAVRERHAEHFRPTIDVRPNKFVWLGTTYPFQAFTFYFKEHQHGLFRVHAYRYQDKGSTFIVECTEDTWRKADLHEASEDETIEYLEQVFADELAGHPLIKNRSIWRNFPTVSNERWHHENIVLVGDAAHTAHFSIGSGTKLAMEDCIALSWSLQRVLEERDTVTRDELERALDDYEARRRPEVESLQRAAQVSLEWFENTERYMDLPAEQFTFSLLTRSLRVSHQNLALRDPALVEQVDRAFAEQAREQCDLASDRPPGSDPGPDASDPAKPAVPPPMFTPFKLRDCVLGNRIVAASPPQNRAVDGVVRDWHVMHLGSLAAGGCALVMTEPVAVSPDGRQGPESSGLYNDGCRFAWARVVDMIHRHTDSKAGVLLSHAGRRSELPRTPAYAASAIPYGDDFAPPIAIDTNRMDALVGEFSGAAERAREAGFDVACVDLSAGSLLAGFLSPLSNQRDDSCGGNLENRLRFPLQVASAVRLVWPAELPLAVKLNVVDWQEGGLTADDSLRIADTLEEAGCDILWVTTGGTVAGDRPPVTRLAQIPFADRIRNQLGIPTIAAGEITTYADINSILAAGRADLCAMTRALVFDPHFVRRVAGQQGYDLPWPEPYAAARGFTPRKSR